MTPEGYQALQAERDRLLGGKTDEQKHRVAVLNATLESVRVVTAPPRDGTARFGSTVTLEWDDGRVQVVRLVGPDELERSRPSAAGPSRGSEAEDAPRPATKPAQGQNISVESPLARTLLEQKEGDEVEVTRPRGVATARLVRVD